MGARRDSALDSTLLSILLPRILLYVSPMPGPCISRVLLTPPCHDVSRPPHSHSIALRPRPLALHNLLLTSAPISFCPLSLCSLCSLSPPSGRADAFSPISASPRTRPRPPPKREPGKQWVGCREEKVVRVGVEWLSLSYRQTGVLAGNATKPKSGCLI